MHLCISHDLRKTFNSFDLNAVHANLVSMGLCGSFIRIVMKCISLPSFSLPIEGEAMLEFTSVRGLRQGDPLSPLLFALVLENLSQDILLVEANVRID